MFWRGLGWSVIVMGALLGAGTGCSKGAGQGPGDGAARGGAGAGGGIGGSNGSRSVTGTGGGISGTGGVALEAGDAATPTDGGIDRPPTADATTDVSAATRAERVCRDALVVHCLRLNECYGVGDAQKGCAQYADRCPDYYFGPRSERTVDAVEACVAAIRQMSCTDMLMGLGSACLAGGTGAAGAPCSAASECASRACSGFNPTCGTCYPPLDLGAACGAVTVGSCRTDTICHPARRVCAALPLVVAHARLGGPCNTSGDPPVGCEGDLVCLVPRGSTIGGTCVDLPNAGELCLDIGGNGARCAKGLECGLSTADGGRTLICGGSAVCGTKICPATEYCYEAPTVSIRCLPYALAGQPCSYNVPEGTVNCTPALVCSGTTTVMTDGGTGFRGTCNALVDLGESCDNTRPCRQPLVCSSGKCARFDSESCFLPTDGGAGQ